MRKVFLEDLPTWECKTTYYGKIKWKNCIGHKVRFIYDDIEGHVIISDYIKDILTVTYNERNYNISTYNFSKCQLSVLLNLKCKGFKVAVGSRFNNKNRDMVILDKKFITDNGGTQRKWYKYKCNTCGWDEGWIEESHLIGKRCQGCSCCKGLTVVEGINDIPTTNEWMVKYFQGGYDEAKLYTCQSNRKINPICPFCGLISNSQVTISSIYKIRYFTCSCSDGVSYPNKFIRYLMHQLKALYPSLEYEFEYQRDWTGKRSYDCWFKRMNKEYFVEMDGEQHKNGIFKHYGGRSLEEEQINDEFKNNLARKNNIDIIRIDRSCTTHDKFVSIKDNVLKSIISSLFDLSLIDWHSLSESCEKNIVKEVADYWNKKDKDTTMTDIANKFKTNRSVIRSYLKRGSKLGWCDYDPKIETKETILKNKIKNSKQVMNIETGIIFDSTHDCSRKSKDVFGRFIDSSSISQVCRGDRYTVYGLQFKYINN